MTTTVACTSPQEDWHPFCGQCNPSPSYANPAATVRSRPCYYSAFPYLSTDFNRAEILLAIVFFQARTEVCLQVHCPFHSLRSSIHESHQIRKPFFHAGVIRSASIASLADEPDECSSQTRSRNSSLASTFTDRALLSGVRFWYFSYFEIYISLIPSCEIASSLSLGGIASVWFP